VSLIVAEIGCLAGGLQLAFWGQAMSKLKIFVLATSAAAILSISAAQVLSASGADAATIDTYAFSEVGWVYELGTEPIAGALLSGAFIGVVEPTGQIKLSDLSSFSAVYLGGPAPVAIPLSSLFSFSFNTTGGASSLNIYAVGGLNANILCVGADASLSLGCKFQPFDPNLFPNPPGTDGAFFIDIQNGPFYLTSEQPTLTLISSITSTPRPAALPLFAGGLGALGLFGGRRKRRPIAA
jgi:hypothetical protein